MLDRKWEKFQGGPAARGGGSATERVTINRKGNIYMNSHMYAALGSPKAVALYYSRDDDAIALEPAYPRFDENFPVHKKEYGWVVLAASFCRHHKICIPNTERFLRPDLTNEGQLILNLRDTVTVGGIKKGPRRSVS